jgi:hypothetical protein
MGSAAGLARHSNFASRTVTTPKAASMDSETQNWKLPLLSKISTCEEGDEATTRRSKYDYGCCVNSGLGTRFSRLAVRSLSRRESSNF